MSSLYVEEDTLLISNYGIPTAVRDNRRPREKQFAVYIILISTLLERIAFYTLATNLAITLEPIKVHENSSSNSITPFIFFGK
jgi:bacteriorhodopsin